MSNQVWITLQNQLKGQLPLHLLEWTGFVDFQQLLRELQALLHQTLATEIDTLLFIEGEQKQVWGFKMAQSNDLVVHFYPPERSKETLTTLLQIQKLAHAQKFQAPQTLLPPHAFGQCRISIELCLLGSRKPHPHQSGDIQLMAQTLARLHQVTCTLHALPALPHMQIPCQALFSKAVPKERRSETEWLGVLTHTLLRRLRQETGRQVLSPMYWTPSQLQIKQQELAAVYSWSKLTLQPELWALGRAMASLGFLSQTEPGQPASTIEMQRFLATFCEVRGVPFLTSELRYLEASLTWAMAEIALKEQQSDPHNRHWEGSYREALTKHAHPYYLSLL
ncbi:MAG: hypothetical protein IV090_10865 [Candidatus Sericytochromatia bacterium]|nr:hypothetical protein [Candidatus Sericytochromatia bacterium]